MAVVPMVPGMPPMQFYPPLLPYNFYTGNTEGGSRNEEPWGTPFQSSMMDNMQQQNENNPFQSSMTNNMQQGNENEESETEKAINIAIMLLLPFFLFPADTAAYFGATELISVFLTKLGVSDEMNLLFVLFVQCVDVKALRRGRFKVVEGWNANYYSELWDTLAGILGFNDIIRLGSQYIFPQSPAPTYED